jgi:hypothetical protein
VGFADSNNREIQRADANRSSADAGVFVAQLEKMNADPVPTQAQRPGLRSNRCNDHTPSPAAASRKREYFDIGPIKMKIA